MRRASTRLRFGMRFRAYGLGWAAIFALLAACGDSGTGGAGGENTGGAGAGNTGGAGGTGGDGEGLIGLGPGFSCDPGSAAPPAVTLTEITTDVADPVQVKSPPGRPDTLFIVEQSGRIRIFDQGALLATPFLDVTDLIECCGEEGLLGLAFHPEYETNGRFFIHYSNAGNGDSTVMEYARSSDPNVADPTPVQLVVQHYTDESNHNGGAVEFGNDGYLYVSLGDGGAQGDPGCDAQNPDNLLGKILRLDVDATPDAEGYPAAPDNPGGEKFYHLGFRNAWRIAFDPCNGDLYIGDVGQNEWEEVSVAPGGSGALNFGWPMREGAHDYPGDCSNPPPTSVDPIAEYPHEDTAVCGANSGSVTGGYVYRGSATPDLRGWYFYGDFCSGKIWMVKAQGGLVVTPAVDAGISQGGLSAFGYDGNGEVYVVGLGGSVSRIDAGQ